MRATRIDGALVVLAAADQHDRPTVQAAAHDATLLAWDELRARQIWKGLPACDHAAMYRLLARADSVRAPCASIANTASDLAADVAQMTRLWEPSSPMRLPHGDNAAALLGSLDRLPSHWRALVLGGQRDDRYQVRTPLDEAVEWAAHHSSKDLAPPPAESDWRAEWDRKGDEQCGGTASKRLANLPNGWQVDTVRRIVLGEDALGAASNAALSINVIRSYGIAASSCTAPTAMGLTAVRPGAQKDPGEEQRG